MNTNHLQTVFLATTISMMLPFPIACTVIVIATLYCLKVIPFPTLINKKKPLSYLLGFFIMATVSSTISQNWIGFAVLVAFLIFSIFSIYYYHFITKQTFEKILHIMLIASVPHALYAALEGWFILPPIDYNAIHPLLITWRDGRADSFFFNPNYYALACSFFILIAGYKAYNEQTAKGQFLYASIALLNGFGLLFTLTRTILPSAFIALVTFGLLVHSKRFKRALVALSVIGITVAIYFYRDIPRFNLEEVDEHIHIRTGIWQATLRELEQTWLIGQGPLTYMTIYEKYNSDATQHAHNLFLDTLLNYGVIGFSFLVGAFYHLARKIIAIRHCKELRSLYALVVSMIVLVGVHGIVDVTIVWVQTLYIFAIVILAIPNVSKNHVLS